MNIDIRPASDSDREFLFELHYVTMRDAIEATWGWDDAWQRQEFERRIREYETSVIERDGRAVGALVLENRPDSIYVHELQVAPDEQGEGVGTAVMGCVVANASKRGLAVTLSVLMNNPRAKRLYERLGFEVEAFEAPFFRMRYL